MVQSVLRNFQARTRIGPCPRSDQRPQKRTYMLFAQHHLARQLVLFIGLMTLVGCASSYRSIHPPSLSYPYNESHEGLELAYRHDVLEEVGNKKFAKKERKHGIRLLAVKLKNETQESIHVGHDLQFYTGWRAIEPIGPEAAREIIKQKRGIYLLYMLFTFTTLEINDSGSYPIGLALGPGLTLRNFVVAGKANKNLLQEMHDYDLVQQTIAPGETSFGLLVIRSSGHEPLSVEWRKR